MKRLVIDKKIENCGECNFHFWDATELLFCDLAHKTISEGLPRHIPDWCPLDDYKEE